MDINPLLKIILEKMKDDISKWLPCGHLKPEDITRRKCFDSTVSELEGRGDVLIAKLKAVKAEMQAVRSEFWENLHKTYSLPRDGEYHLDDQNRILKKPKSKDDVGTCFCGQCK